MKKARRPAAKKVPGKKAVPPAVKEAEAKADVLENRIINDALERVRAATTVAQVNNILAKLTAPELKTLARQVNVRPGRKAQMIHDIAALFVQTD